MNDVQHAQECAVVARLDEGLRDLGLELSIEQKKRLRDYVGLLEKWNRVYNLTAVRDPARMVGLHILDSLSLVPYLKKVTRVLDVGTGGGLPGIPLSIALPDLSVTMLDSLQKKTTFIRQSIGELDLPKAEVVCERVEQFKAATPYEVIVSRAFAEIADFVAGASHLLAPGGRMFAMKGVLPHAEMKKLPAPYVVKEVIELAVPQIEAKRHLVVIEKK
jgi:16S rRNA (guanine527-N7)-methyltransferase